jgi:predicted RNA binding protein YcfA (HicA-like mRNA interferase family)
MTYRFSALISREDGWHVARCPKPDVTSQGKDVESLLVLASAKRSTFTLKPGACLRRGPPKANPFGQPSKSPTDMLKLPSISGDRVMRALIRAGFAELRKKGSQVSLERRVGDQVFKTVVPLHRDLAKGPLRHPQAVRIKARRVARML